MTQTSGSITIETSPLAAAIVKGLTPSLEALHTSLSGLAAGLQPAVRYDDLIGVLIESLPGMEDTIRQTAEHQAYRLSEMGYVLVHAPVPDLVAVADTEAEALAREDKWFER